jgi:DNA-binding CsgD family transcriptional regulator
VLELGLGDAEAALRHARQITTTLAAVWSALDRIDAAARAGERETALGWLGAFAPWAESVGAPWARGVVLHCGALLSDGDQEAEELFAAASDRFARAARPFERARTELALGEHLRRRRRRVEARAHLHAALDGFEALGARAWAERARLELRASGRSARRHDPGARAELTPQELQVARFVAEGRPNREVAAQLFLSPRTVEFHLRNVFRKLGIATRTELARIDLDGVGGRAARAEDPVIPPV